MKTIVINASPRPEGNSAFLADSVKEKLGSDASVLHLREKNILSCRACRACKKNGSLCVIADDMRDIYPTILEAGKIVFVTPNHFGFLSSLGKVFLDRWYCLKTADRISKFPEGTKAVFLLVQGAPSRDHGKNIQEWAKHFFNGYGVKYFGMTLPGCSAEDVSGVRLKLDETLAGVSFF